MVANLSRIAGDPNASALFAKLIGGVANRRRTTGKLAVGAGVDADALAANLAGRAKVGCLRVVDDSVAIVVEAVADLGAGRRVRHAVDRHSTVRALRGAVGADARHHRVARDTAALAVETGDVEDEIVEVTVAPVGGPARGRHREIFVRDVVRARINGRLIDQRRDPRYAVLSRDRVELGLGVLCLAALTGISDKRKTNLATSVVRVGADDARVPRVDDPSMLTGLIGIRVHDRERAEITVLAADAVGRRLRQIRGNERVDLVCSRRRRAPGRRVVPPERVLAAAAVKDDLARES